MALLSDWIPLSRINFIANHLPWNCTGEGVGGPGRERKGGEGGRGRGRVEEGEEEREGKGGEGKEGRGEGIIHRVNNMHFLEVPKRRI